MIRILVANLSIHSRRNRPYLFQTVVSNHCGCTPRSVRGVKRPEILWEIHKYSLPGRPSSQNWVKSKTIKKNIKIHQKMANGFWFYSILAGWSTWQWVFMNFSQNFWSFDTPYTPGCSSAVYAESEIWNRFKQFLPVWYLTTQIQGLTQLLVIKLRLGVKKNLFGFKKNLFSVRQLWI